MGAQALFLPIRRRLEKEKREKRTRSLQKYLVPGAVHASTQQTTSKYTNQRYGRLSCAKKLLVSRDSLIARSTCYKQSNAFLQRRRKAKRSFPMERGPTAKHHPAWNPQCTQWFRAEFPLLPLPYLVHRKSRHAPVSVMLEKRGGRCRTDGPIRVLPCQMRHTIAATKAAWCRSLS